MNIKTGQTVIEDILSLDGDNNPVTIGVTFDIVALKDGVVYTGITVSTVLEDTSRGIFSASWSADTFGTHQLYIKNMTKQTLFLLLTQ